MYESKAQLNRMSLNSTEILLDDERIRMKQAAKYSVEFQI